MPSCDERLSPEADAAARYARTVALIEEIAERERMSPARVRARAYTDELIARRRAALGAGDAVGAGLRSRPGEPPLPLGGRVGVGGDARGARTGGAAVLNGLRNGSFRVSALLDEDDAAGRVRLAAPSLADLDAPALVALLEQGLAAAAALPEAEAAEIDALVRKVIADHRAELDAFERARGRELTLADLPAPILRALIEALDGALGREAIVGAPTEPHRDEEREVPWLRATATSERTKALELAIFAPETEKIRKLFGVLQLLVVIAIILFLLGVLLPLLLEVRKRAKKVRNQQRITAIGQKVLRLFPDDPGAFRLFFQLYGTSDQQLDGMERSGEQVRKILHPRFVELITRSRGAQFTDEEEAELEGLLDQLEKQLNEFEHHVPRK